MPTLEINSALSEVTPVMALNIPPGMVLNGRLLAAGVAVAQAGSSEEGELLEVWEDTAPSRCSPLDDF